MINSTNLSTTTPLNLLKFKNQIDNRDGPLLQGALACGGQMINANNFSHVLKSKILMVQRNWFQNSLRALNLALHF